MRRTAGLSRVVGHRRLLGLLSLLLLGLMVVTVGVVGVVVVVEGVVVGLRVKVVLTNRLVVAMAMAMTRRG